MDNQSNPKRYSDADLQEFKVLIEKKLEKEKRELQIFQEQINEINENNNDQQGVNWYDDSNLNNDLEMLNSMVTRKQQFIANLEAALVRVHNKTYGICTVTGELIDKRRLLLVPHATKSVEAKEMEKKADKIIIDKEDLPFTPPSASTQASGTKIIEKIIRKPSSSSSKKKQEIEEDDLEVGGFDDDYEEGIIKMDSYDLNPDDFPDDSE